MTTTPASHSDSRVDVSVTPAKKGSSDLRVRLLILTLSALFFATLIFAQGQSTPKITKVDPSSGKVSDSITVSGADLGKDAVAGVFLSDDKSDYKATIVSQAADKIVMKVPQVKPGGYNLSIQVGGTTLIEPVRFTVQE
jgi:IPT/TIG domain-containing protein